MGLSLAEEVVVFDFADVVKDVDFTQVFSGIYDMMPYIIPAVIGWLAFRKGWGWLKGQIKGA